MSDKAVKSNPVSREERKQKEYNEYVSDCAKVNVKPLSIWDCGGIADGINPFDPEENWYAHHSQIKELLDPKCIAEKKLKEASPELLSALIELVDFAKNTVNHSDYINNYDDLTKKEDVKMIEKAEQAIKKATV